MLIEWQKQTMSFDNDDIIIRQYYYKTRIVNF